MNKIIYTSDGSIGFQASYYRSHITRCRTRTQLPQIIIRLSKGVDDKYSYEADLIENVAVYQSDETMYKAANELAEQLKRHP